MSALERTDLELLFLLDRWMIRRRAVESATAFARGLTLGLTVGVLIALAARLFPILVTSQTAALAGACAAMGALAALAVAWLRPITPIAAARYFDGRFDLAERVSAALEIQRGILTAPDELARQQRADALAHARRVNVAARLPFLLPRRESLAAIVLAAALVAALFLPNPMQGILARQAAVRAAQQQSAQQLEQIRAQVAANDRLPEAERQAMLRQLDETIARLQSGQLTQEQAVAELSQAQGRLQTLADPQANRQQAGLARAAQDFGGTEPTKELAQALAQGDAQRAADILQSLAGTEGRPLTPEEMKQLAQELHQAAQTLQNSNPDLARQMEQAAQAIDRDDIDAARQSLGQAAQTLDQTGQRIASSQAAQQAAQAAAQGRQAVAQAGQPAIDQVASKQGTQPGTQGQGQGQGQEQGGGGAGAGRGADSGQGGQGGPVGQNPIGQENAPGDGGLVNFDPVYAPLRLGGQGGPSVGLPGQPNPQGPVVGTGPLAAPESGQSLVPYSDVYGQYAQQAGIALDSGNIPLGYRGYVKQYFSSLQP